jgi:hypothetical protein
MAHPCAAQTLLIIFRHPQTPEHFVILSGDVHYSFVYDVDLRGRLRGPEVWQITISGVRNAFPDRLRIQPRKPAASVGSRRLLNGT